MESATLGQIEKILVKDWTAPISEFIESKDFDNIISKLRNEKKLGFNIQPSTDRVFRALNLCTPDKVKVIMCAQDPYNSLTKDGGHIADGLAFSCGMTGMPQPSLRNIWLGVTKTYGISQMEANQWNLEYLAKQGVLLINSSLTVRSWAPNSHQGLWDKFLDEIFYEVIGKSTHPIVYMLLGREAQNRFSRYARIGDYILTAMHPAAAAYTGGIWDCQDVFRRCNNYLELSELEPIKW